MADIVKLPPNGVPANTTKPWREPSWLAEWRGTEMPPVPADDIRSSISEANEYLRPANDEAIAVLLAPLADLWGEPRPQAIAIYFEALGDIPPAALAAAVGRCIRECRFYPSPAEIIERADEFHQLRMAKRRLEFALWRIEFQQKRGRWLG